MKIIPSDRKAALNDIGSVLSAGKKLASATETVLDKEFIEKLRHDWCWVGFEDTPAEKRWYRVDRENGKLIKIPDDEASGLQWHERLFIYESALTAAKDGSPLALYIGDEYSDGRLSALYLCGPDYLAWIAEK